MPCKFIDNGIKSKLLQKRKLSSFIEAQIQKQTKRASYLQYIFVTDNQLLELNQHYLQHNTLTDIITFDLSDSSDVIQSEIYISIERVQENANKFNTSYEQELHRVIFHGALHLCGYKDKTKQDKLAMTKAEDAWLRKYFGE